MPVTLRFVTDDSMISRLIRAGEYGDPFPTHVEALMPDGTLLGAHYDGGVQARAADYDAATWTMQHFVTLPCSDDQAHQFHDVLHSQIGKPYDLKVIEEIAAGAILGERNWRQADHWICSELQAWALEGPEIIFSLPVGVDHVTPRDLYLVCGALTAIGKPQVRVAQAA